MADVINGNPGTAPNTPAPGGDGGRPAPQTSQIDPAEFQRLQSEVTRYQRQEQQFKSNQDFYNKARQYGLTDEKSLDSWGSVIKTASTRGVTPSKLGAIFDDSGASEAATSREAIAITEESLGRILTEREQATIKKFHAQKLEEDLAAERGEFSEERINKEFDGLPDEFKKYARHAASGLYLEKRQPFPEGHPLHGHFAPAGKDGIASIYNDLKGVYKSLEEKLAAKLKAENMTAIGKAASKQTTTTVAGNGGGSGTPDNKNRDWKDAAREEAEAHIARRRAARA